MNFCNPPEVHAPVAAYSHQVDVGPGARWLVLSGQIGMRPDGTLADGAVAQLAVALDNIRRNLDAAGMAVEDIVKLTVYLVGEVSADERRDVLSAFFGAHRPCMTLLYVVGLAAPAIKVEVDAWAAREVSPS